MAFRFNPDLTSAIRVAERQAAKFVVGVSRETKKALRAIIVRSIREGIPPYDAARSIRGLIGMNVPQMQAAMDYRTKLINSGLSMQRVNDLVDRYSKRKIRERAEMIARHEIVGALNEGAIESWKQAQKAGYLGKKAKKEWIAGSIRPCPICEDLDGSQVALTSLFRGGYAGPPAHPRCRCSTAVVP